MCEHINTIKLADKVINYVNLQDKTENLLITIPISLCLDCGYELRSRPVVQKIYSYCGGLVLNPECEGIIFEINGLACASCKSKNISP